MATEFEPGDFVVFHYWNPTGKSDREPSPVGRVLQVRPAHCLVLWPEWTPDCPQRYYDGGERWMDRDYIDKADVVTSLGRLADD